MDHSTPPTPETQPVLNLLLAASPNYLWAFLNTCPHAQTLTGRDTLTGQELIIPLPCKQWACRWCAAQKIRVLSVRTRDARPTRMLTLTVDPKLWPNPRAAFDGTRRKIADLITYLRDKFGELEYLRVTELTAHGWPHYHFLIRSAYLPHALVKAKWAELTGATIVDIRQVRKSFAAYTYLVKYLSKLHRIEWTERHVSYSRNFFPPAEPYERQPIDFHEPTIVSQHPYNYILERLPHAVLRKISSSVIAVESHAPITSF